MANDFYCLIILSLSLSLLVVTSIIHDSPTPSIKPQHILVNFETQVRMTVLVFSPGLTTGVGETK